MKKFTVHFGKKSFKVEAWGNHFYSNDTLPESVKNSLWQWFFMGMPKEMRVVQSA